MDRLFCTDEHAYSPAFKSYSGSVGNLEIDRCKSCPAVRVTQSTLVAPDWREEKVVTYVPALEPDREAVIREGISSENLRHKGDA